jgi:hypothetical protein
LHCAGDQNSRPAFHDYVQMPLQPLELWMEIAVLETLLDTWLEHSGSRDRAYAALDREFRSALGPDFDISAFETLDKARTVETKYIKRHGLKKDKQTRHNRKTRYVADSRLKWNAPQCVKLRDGQPILEFLSLAQE